jgi:tripartite-type tricarboxylate transporter receptor subunit TctC
MRGITGAAVLTTICCTSGAWAQSGAAANFPSKPVRLMLGPGPGSVADGLTRVLAAAMSELWGQQVVVENRSGAGNTIAPAYVAKAPPDGYTLHRCGVGDAIAPALYKNLSYSHLRDFAILARIGLSPNILVIHPSIPAKNLKAYVALAKANPGKLEYGSTGRGSSPQLSFELLKGMTKADITFVPYKSAALAQNDLLAGRISAHMSNLPNYIAPVKEGKVRALGVTTAKRSHWLPDVPAIAEELPGYDVSSWYGVCAPIGVDKTVQKKIETDVLALLKQPKLQQRLTDMGVIVEPLDAAAFTEFFRAETERWAKVARESGIEPQ